MPTKVFSTSGWAPYADRATAAAATVPAWIDTISYIGPSRDVLQFVEDADATTPALTTGDGRKWVPIGGDYRKTGGTTAWRQSRHSSTTTNTPASSSPSIWR